MPCIKCGHKLLLGKVWIDVVYPDDEPYKSGEHINVDEIDIGEQLLVHYCENCKIIHDIWDDEQIHLIGHNKAMIKMLESDDMQVAWGDIERMLKELEAELYSKLDKEYSERQKSVRTEFIADNFTTA